MAAPDYPFVALRDLSLNGVRAFAKGDPIPDTNEGITGRTDAAGNAVEPEWTFGEDYADAESEAAEEAIAGPQRPANSASKAAWVDYAAALFAAEHPLGLPADVAEGMTRDQIIEHVDGQLG